MSILNVTRNACLIGAGHPDQPRNRAQGREIEREIERDIARTTRTPLDLARRARGLEGEAIRRTMPMAVEHQVPGNPYPDLFETGTADLHLWLAC